VNQLSKLLPIFIILALIGLGTGGYYYVKYQKVQKDLESVKADPSTAQKAAEAEAKMVTDEVRKLMELPDESPTVATITDIEKLKEQAFFQKGKNGDKVLIFTNAKKAILFDPNSKKILDVAPLNIGTPSAQVAPQAKIGLRNGTTTSGLTNNIESTIKKEYPQSNIASKENATKTDYQKSVIVVLNDTAKGAAENLSKTLNIPLGALPEGENKPANIDILIIVGSDKS
jgi:hypothetical protein